jgi:hypothetical protein
VKVSYFSVHAFPSPIARTQQILANPDYVASRINETSVVLKDEKELRPKINGQNLTT